MPFRKMCMSLTNCGSQDKSDEIASQKNVQCHSLSVGHRIRCDENSSLKNVQYHSPTVCHRTRCDATFRRLGNVTHTLLVIGQDVKNVQCHSHPVDHRI